VTASEAPGAVEVRLATAGDAELLLAWANDPTTRATSFRPRMIAADDHRRWLAEMLASPSTRLLIGHAGSRPVGLVRLERDPVGTVEVGISVERGARGRGLGRSLLTAALDAARRDAALEARSFLARVRVDNDASIGLFQGAGFMLRERSVCHGVPCLVFELPGA
jgi:RimJ/RimL family protein N-acetyltransferase